MAQQLSDRDKIIVDAARSKIKTSPDSLLAKLYRDNWLQFFDEMDEQSNPPVVPSMKVEGARKIISEIALAAAVN